MKLSVILASGCLAAGAALASVANATPVTAANFTAPPKGTKPTIVASFKYQTPVSREAVTAALNEQRRAQAVKPESQTVDLATTTPDAAAAGQ
jgi:hypothetical protein